MSHPLPVTVAVRPPEYSTGYATECLFAEQSPSYYCSPSNPQFPVSLTLDVTAHQATLERVLIDTRVKGWETSAARHVALEVAAPGADAFEPVAELELERDALQHVILPEP